MTCSQASQLLGVEGALLMRDGGARDPIDSDRDVYQGCDLLRFRIEDPEATNKLAIVTRTLRSGRKRQIHA